MRLIDAENLMTVTDICEDGTEITYVPYSEIESVPTAYDVDKVVEELRQRSKEYNSGVRLHGKPEEMLTEDAIEIVKAGGRDER